LGKRSNSSIENLLFSGHAFCKKKIEWHIFETIPSSFYYGSNMDFNEGEIDF